MDTTTICHGDTIAHEQSHSQQPWPHNYLYEEFAGPQGEEYLNAILQQILPTALWRTWRCAVSFQAPGRALFVGVSRMAAKVKPGERKIYLDLQELVARRLLTITPTCMQITQQDGTIVTRVVSVKDFSGLYALAHDYHRWLSALNYIPADREGAAYLKTQPALMQQLLRFDNYRRLLLCKKPGRKAHPKEAHLWYACTAEPEPPVSVSPPSSSLEQRAAHESSKHSGQDVNLFSHPSDNPSSPQRINTESFYTRDSFDSEIRQEGEEGHSPTESPCHDEASIPQMNETHEQEQPIPDAPSCCHTTEAIMATKSCSLSRQSTKPSDQQRQPDAQRPQQIALWKRTHQEVRTPMQQHTRENDGKSRPLPNRMVSSFLREIALLFGDQNIKASITRALRLTQQAGLTSQQEILACLVKAYHATHKTQRVKYHNADGSPNKMPLFLTLLSTFANACAAGKLPMHDLEADIAADDRLVLWVIEQGLQLDPPATPAAVPPQGMEQVAPGEEAIRIEVAVPLPTQQTPLSTETRPAVPPESWVIVTDDDPTLGWSCDSACYWAERLQDYLGRDAYRSTVYATTGGKWGFVLRQPATQQEWIFLTTDEVRACLYS
jgi:hypothetical protein